MRGSTVSSQMRARSLTERYGNGRNVSAVIAVDIVLGRAECLLIEEDDLVKKGTVRQMDDSAIVIFPEVLRIIRFSRV